MVQRTKKHNVQHRVKSQIFNRIVTNFLEITKNQYYVMPILSSYNKKFQNPIILMYEKFIQRTVLLRDECYFHMDLDQDLDQEKEKNHSENKVL